MKNNVRGSALTDAEKRSLSKATFLYCLYYIFEFVFIIYDTIIIKIGAYHIGVELVCVSLSVIITFVCAVMYFKKVKFIKKHQKKFFCFLVVIFITTGCHIFVSSDYIFDIAGGKEEITTNEYYVTNIYNHLQFMDGDGRKTSVIVSDEMKKKLNQNELISHSFEEYFSNNELYYHKEEIRLTYYPHSGVLVQLVLDE